jgi:predicted HicB family RNase H-like nuclease
MSANLNTMKYGGYTAKIEYDDDDEIFFGRLAGIRDGVTFHADNVAELKAAFHEAVDDCIEMCAKIGKEPQLPCSGILSLTIAPAVHLSAALAAEAAGKSGDLCVEEVFDKAATQLETQRAQKIGDSAINSALSPFPAIGTWIAHRLRGPRMMCGRPRRAMPARQAHAFPPGLRAGPAPDRSKRDRRHFARGA